VIGRLVPVSRPSLPVSWPLSLLADIRAIADSTRVLPEVLERLASIEPRVESLDSEVAAMRQAVESIGVDVIDLRDAVHPIQRTAGRLGRMTARIPRDPRAR
jgi:hypothetical protein